jgi:hypothetical protein
MEISELIGKTIKEIKGGAGDDTMTFVCADGTVYTMYHSQDCCESVYIADIVGDLPDLIGTPILRAEESTSGDRPADLPAPEYEAESQTWTFYKLATVKGWVDIRWYGSSNGYYSEGVTFARA